MALNFSRACQTVFAYRSLTASLLKRFKIQYLIGVELLWHGIEGGIFKINGWCTSTATEVTRAIGEEDEAALETKVQFPPANIKGLELVREAVNRRAWISKDSTQSSLQKSSDEFCPSQREYRVVKNGCALHIWKSGHFIDVSARALGAFENLSSSVAGQLFQKQSFGAYCKLCLQD